MASVCLIAAACALLLPIEAYGQAGKGNAHIMDIHLGVDADTVACLGSPGTVTVKPGDVLVFRAERDSVAFVDWEMSNPTAERPLSRERFEGKGRTPGFPRGRAYAIRINRSIQDSTAYELKLRCGGKGDGPPTVIVDP
jgi:hypothetical protein